MPTAWVTGHKRGSCTITVKTADGSNRKASIKINVLQPVQGVHMEKDTYRVGIDEGLRITAVLEPSDASNTNMTWSVADSSIASIRGTNNRPVVTGKRWGTTTVTGVTEDGGFSTTATIKTGNYNKAVKITDLYVSDNKIKIVVKNESNMNITKFFFDISCYDLSGNPLPCAPTAPIPSAAPMATPFMRATAPSMASSTLRTLSSPKRPSAAWS